MITDDDIERIVPGETRAKGGISGEPFVIYAKIFVHNEWRLVSDDAVWESIEYRDWTILEPTLDLEKLEPGKTILQHDIGGWYRLFIARVGEEGILATEAESSIKDVRSNYLKNVPFIPYAICKTWTIVEEGG